MATDPAPRRHYWQLPTFALGIAAAVAAYANFPPPPPNPAARFGQQLTELKQALDRRPIDLVTVERLAPQVATDADQYPGSSAQARFLAGSGYLALAESSPSDSNLWALAAGLLSGVEPNQLPDPEDGKKLLFRQAKAQAAQEAGDPAALVAALLTPPLGEDTDGERLRLLADASLRLTPPDWKRARDALTAYLTGPSKIPPAGLARYRMKLAEAHLNLNEPERARTWLKEIGPAAPPDVQAAARTQLARLAAAENNWPEAAKLYEAALATTDLPDDQRGALRYQAGVAYVQLRNPTAAIPHLEEAVKDSGPVGPAAAVKLAELLLRDPGRRGQRSRAVELLEQAAAAGRSGTDFRNPYLTVEEVRAAFEEAVQVCVNEAEFGSAVRAATAYAAVAAPGRDREKRAEVNAAWAAVLQKTPATAAQAPAKFQEAARDYLALAATYPTPAGQADLFRRAADCFRRGGDAASAAAVIDQITRTTGLTPDVVAAAWLEKGDLLLAGGRTAEAVAALQKAVETPGPQAARARVRLAVAHLEQARQGGPEARKLIKFASDLLAQSADSTSPDEREAQAAALFELGKLLLNQGSVPDAEARFRQLVQTQRTGPLAAQGKLYLGSCLLLLARGDHQGGRPPADADRKLTEAAQLFAELSESSDPFLKTQADIRLANATLLLKKYDEMPALGEKLAARYRGKIEELIVLSMVYSAYRFADRPEPAARTLTRMEEVFAALPATEFRGGTEEYTREYWQKQWFEPLRKKP